MPDIDEELGTYIGPMTIEEVIKALGDHTPGEWVAELQDATGKRLWQKNGWSWFLAENEEEAMFAFGKGQGTGNPAMVADDALVLHLYRAIKMIGECEQYDGGFVIKFPFGEHQGHTLKMLTWSGIKHITPGGDVAPGIA